MRQISSFATGEWLGPGAGAKPISSAITGNVIAEVGNDALNVQSMQDYARDVGGPSLRTLTFHDRARMLKAIALHLKKYRKILYEISFDTGATQSDHLMDIDGGIGTMLVYASKGRREMPDTCVYLDGPPEQLGRLSNFMGQHVCTPLQGAALHINAYNFPVWGMLEKLAPTLLAGMPAIIKPATSTSYVTECCVRLIIESGLLPKGALQLISGNIGDLLNHLDCQDVVTFTGSEKTGLMLRSNPNLLANSIRFTAEQDSLNAIVLGPDVTKKMPEFDLFIDEIEREITAKAGQKCTAIRRIMVPSNRVDETIKALSNRLTRTRIGDPRDPKTNMGALVSNEQKSDVLAKTALIGAEAERVFGNPDDFTMMKSKGAFLPPMLFYCANPDGASNLHKVEVFGPVSTIMPYRNIEHASELLNRGKGSLVASVITHDTDVAKDITVSSAAFHGRLYFNNRDSMSDATGHGAPMPHMTHGGPGRAGGGEELGGIRAVTKYMQRTAIQGSPDILSAIGRKWVPGATEVTGGSHPFTRHFNDLKTGDTLHTVSRQITLEDIEKFADFTGDKFYAHMNEEQARANPFFPGRVAHGYLLLSFAAGLFVHPEPGPVLANIGLEKLHFLKPVEANDSIKVQLTVKSKAPRNDQYGEVKWHVALTNQSDEPVAEYELLTMNAF